MLRSNLLMCIALALLPALAVGADKPATAPSMSAAAIVEKNAEARGGLDAWRGVHTLSWSGKLDAGGNNRPELALPIPGLKKTAQQQPRGPVQLPFTYEMERGRLSRMEIEFDGQTAVQVYNGTHGWKVRPFLNRHEVEPFTADELKAAGAQADLDGALIDSAAKGTKVEVAGVESVEGAPAYKLKLTLKNGDVVHEWVDAKSFLEVKVEGTPRRLDNKVHAVSIYLRDYRKVNGLMIPFLIETRVEGVKQSPQQIHIEKVVVNPSLEESRFVRPA